MLAVEFDLTSKIVFITEAGRVGQLREAGLPASFLASSASDYMTGQTILIDGKLGL